ncbi:ATP-grasp domain-containing protein [Saccharothrix longispora]|uniref:Biotin carboxylase n=1 Tax=Saccharothrix longispora TaxID=33920 RepID=A0ABU1PPV0_9PSEU|nr:ATP-grasp domain-containing protein [Saccharothrix longispora]MDR6592688.1 biotin carboxylase [Saccharothrix longispora]
MSDPVVLFLNLRRTHLEHGAAVEAAHRLGFGVALIADTVPAGLPERVVRVVHKVDTYDLAAVDRAVDAVAAEHDVRGVVTWSDRDVETVSRIAERLGLPAPSVGAARIARNKYLMREALAGHPHTIPRFARITTWDELAKAASDIGYPSVLKPTSASGSKGIFVVRSEDELRPAFDELMRYTRPEVDKVFGDNPNELIFEEFLVGTEHSVEGFVVGGEVVVAGITDKETTEPFRLELAHTFPSSLPPAVQDAARGLAATVVSAIGLDDCTFHLECMAAPDGTVKLVEVAARVGGDFITSHLVGLATGVPFAENVIRVATGSAPVLGTAGPLFSGVRKIMADKAGVVSSVDGVVDALAVPGVRHVAVERSAGASVALPPQDYMSGTLGAVIAVGDSADAVRATLARAVDAVTPRIS